MNQKISRMSKDGIALGLLFVVLLIVYKLFFFNEPLIKLLKVYLGLWWVFVLPGFIILFYWQDKLDFLERFLIGIGISSAIIGIASYYLGLIGLNTKYHGFLLPLILILIGIIINLRKGIINVENKQD